MPSVRVEADVREQVSLARASVGTWRCPKPPYTLEMVEGLREQVQEQRRFKVACENQWDLKRPRFSDDEDDVETFKAAVNQASNLESRS